LVEIGLGLILLMIVVLLIVDVSWLLYHQLLATQAVTRTARRAGTNRFNQAEITDFFFQSTRGSLLTSSNANVTLSVAVTPQDVTFASLDLPGGKPSVTVTVAYIHRFIAPISWGTEQLGSYTITASNSSMITTWSAVPTVQVPSFQDTCPCP